MMECNAVRSNSDFRIAEPLGIADGILDREALTAPHYVCQCPLQSPSATPVKIGSHDCGRTADTCVAMNVHGVSLLQQARQRSDTFGKAQLQVLIVEIPDGNVLERKTGSKGLRLLLFDPTMTSFFFILQAENCSNLEP